MTKQHFISPPSLVLKITHCRIMYSKRVKIRGIPCPMKDCQARFKACMWSFRQHQSHTVVVNDYLGQSFLNGAAKMIIDICNWKHGISQFYTSAYHCLFFQSREAAITFQLTPAIYLSELRYVIKINSSLETMSKVIQKENGSYITDNVNVSYSGNYFYYTTKPYYVELW
jgi:hypothetical protein